MEDTLKLNPGCHP
jgi:hypothetical protein